MIIRKLFIAFFIVNTILLSGCSRTILFTHAMRQKIHQDGLDIREVQFYNSRKLILQRNLSYEETKIAQGEIRFENGKFIELIEIKKHTPGVCESDDSKSLDISFESGENRKLKFMVNARTNYQITALEWKDKFGKVNYDTLTYYIAPGGDKTLLKVKKDYIYKIDKKHRVAPGRKVETVKKTEPVVE